MDKTLLIQNFSKAEISASGIRP